MQTTTVKFTKKFGKEFNVATLELRTRRINQAKRKLDEHHVDYDEANNGTHFILYFDNEPQVDFWPTTGKFYDRQHKTKGRWIKQLTEHITKFYQD